MGVTAFYLACIGMFLTIVFSVLQRQLYGKTIRTIAKAAKRVAEGDFSTRLSPMRRDGKNDFISNVSHEIKSPLAVIQSYSMALKDPEIDAGKREQYIDIIVQTTQSLSRMISNILKLNKLENQEMRPVKQFYPAGEQLRRCALNYMEQWEKKEITFDLEVADVMLCSDDALLDIVWNNLISNAVKFTPEGGRISLTSEVKGNILTVRIRDNGPGIPEGQILHIFDKFYQADESHSSEGNGLGLALVKKILEILHGEIRAESRPGKGTVFSVMLPVEG